MSKSTEDLQTEEAILGAILFLFCFVLFSEKKKKICYHILWKLCNFTVNTVNLCLLLCNWQRKMVRMVRPTTHHVFAHYWFLLSVMYIRVCCDIFSVILFMFIKFKCLLPSTEKMFCEKQFYTWKTASKFHKTSQEKSQRNSK